MSPALPIPIRAFSAVGGLGATTAELLANLDAGTSGLRPIEDPRVPFETVVGRIDRTRLAPVPTPFETYDCHHARLGLLALDEVREAADAAVARWGAHRVGVFLGTSTGGLEATERGYQGWHDAGALPADYGFHTQHDFNALATLMAGLIGAEGPALTISTACSSSGKVFGTAQRWIATGRLDAAIVGGVDSLCRMTVRGFRSLGVLDSDPCRPFSADRKGINIGEGAALFVLEREADDAALELLGVGESSDAHHMSSPHPEGRGAAAAMTLALDAAGLRPADVDYVNAHGTATPLNDAAEAQAIRAVFGPDTPLSSTKRFTGHLLGAAGATELAIVAHAILEGRLPPNLGAAPLDPEVEDLDIVLETRHTPVRRALSNSFAFGGSNVSVLMGART